MAYMEIAIEILSDAVIDTLKLIPFLFLTYLAMEALEHKAGDKTRAAIQKSGKAGPVIGSFLGVVPQCGFSAVAATFYAGRVITLGTLYAVFLSTSDEMLPVFIAEQADIMSILKILGVKVVIGIIMGFVIDFAMRFSKRPHDASIHIHELCEQENCDCHEGEGGIFKSAVKHTLHVTLFIFIITLILNIVIALIGEEALAGFISANPELSIVASALVGLIPNCAASVAIAELYLQGTLGPGAMMAGLLTAAGVGILVLFQTNKKPKENLAIVVGLLAIGIVWGLIIQATGFTF